MFFKQVLRNARMNRKGNGLFYAALVIAIVAFYTLLSLREQDVLRFLATLESASVAKLMGLLPLVYLVSLFFVFFLVYFACKYQADRRRREFGLYLMLGMKKSRLFFLLFAETLWNSLVALAIGLPLAILLTELISILTASFVGLGLLQHRFTLSAGAILWTVIGFVCVQLLATLTVCLPLGKAEPAELLATDAPKAQKIVDPKKSKARFVSGIALLLIAYFLGVFFLRALDLTVLVILVCGAAGTFLLYRGLGGFIGERIEKARLRAKGLDIFDGRQIQENVAGEHKSLAISSLLLMVALTCVVYGISLGIANASYERSADASLLCGEEELWRIYDNPELSEMIGTVYPMYVSVSGEEADAEALRAAIRAQGDDTGLADFLYLDYMIPAGAFDALLEASGKEKLNLAPGTCALYSAMIKNEKQVTVLEKALMTGVTVTLGGQELTLVPGLHKENIVADTAISLYAALIVPDEVFEAQATRKEPYCFNLHLTDAAVAAEGLMLAMQRLDGLLSGTGLEYETYLAGIGRNLIYTVSTSYLTIYLGVLFFLIANTVMGLKFLIQLREDRHRYETLFVLGAEKEEVQKSVRKQIRIYFLLVMGLALLSGLFAVVSLSTVFLSATVREMAGLAAVTLAVFLLLEALYIYTVSRLACREIDSLE